MSSAVRHSPAQWALAPGDTSAVPVVRRGVMSALRARAGDADLWSAELVVGEVLSNAVTHSSGPASVILSWDDAHPTLTVCDQGPGPATLQASALPEDPLATGGRGLFLMASLALDVTVAADGQGGSQVEVLLDVPLDAARSA